MCVKNLVSQFFFVSVVDPLLFASPLTPRHIYLVSLLNLKMEEVNNFVRQYD